MQIAVTSTEERSGPKSNNVDETFRSPDGLIITQKNLDNIYSRITRYLMNLPRKKI